MRSFTFFVHHYLTPFASIHWPVRAPKIESYFTRSHAESNLDSSSFSMCSSLNNSMCVWVCLRCASVSFCWFGCLNDGFGIVYRTSQFVIRAKVFGWRYFLLSADHFYGVWSLFGIFHFWIIAPEHRRFLSIEAGKMKRKTERTASGQKRIESGNIEGIQWYSVLGVFIVLLSCIAEITRCRRYVFKWALFGILCDFRFERTKPDMLCFEATFH